MNVHDSEKLAGSLEQQGYVKAASAAKADVVLLNTCSIREKAAEKVFSELGRLKPLKRKNPGMLIGVCGCVGQQEGEGIFGRAPHVDFVLGPRATGSLGGIVSRLRAGEPGERHRLDLAYRADSIEFPFDEIRREGTGSAKAFVTIVEGCNHRCTYCVVPKTRGPEICRPAEEILDEVRSLVARGFREVELLGQTVNAYRDARGRRLADLLMAGVEIDGLERIRFTTSHPAQMTEELMDAVGRCQPRVCPYLHLPVQSGSSSVLRAMRRGYDRDGYLEKIEGLRRRVPEMHFGSDVIVGFPTETEREFEATLALLDEVRFDSLYSFVYSPRPGTRALELGDPVPQQVKMERLRRLQAHQKRIQELRNRRWVGRQVEVLVAGRSKRVASRWTGRSPENRVVNFTGESAPGRLETVAIRGATAYSLSGVLAKGMA